MQTLDAGRSEGGLSAPVLGAVAGSISLMGLALAVPALRGIFGLVVPTPFSWLLVASGALLALLLSRALPLAGNGLGKPEALPAEVSMKVAPLNGSASNGVAALPVGGLRALPEPV